MKYLLRGFISPRKPLILTIFPILIYGGAPPYLELKSIVYLIWGGPPIFLPDVEKYGGPPHLMGGPPHIFQFFEKNMGGPPHIMGGPPHLKFDRGEGKIVKRPKF